MASVGGNDQPATDHLAAVGQLAAAIDPQNRPPFYELINSPSPLNREQATELARILLPIYKANASDVNDKMDPTAEELCAAWFTAAQQGPSQDTSGEFGFAQGTPAGPGAAGWWEYLDPRWPLRLATVWQMKDRAGVVGSYGVGPILRDLMAKAPRARFHLVGHSFGCKVVLSALCYDVPPRPVESALLIQPAISAYCFAADAGGTGQPGGFREALKRVSGQILLTFSHQDSPLYRFFHLAVRRKSDIGDVDLAAGNVSLYAALGGYGPQGLPAEECRVEPMRQPEEGPYTLGANTPKVVALNGGVLVTGHSNVTIPATAFALGNLVFPRP
jgi:hypothetical protein